MSTFATHGPAVAEPSSKSELHMESSGNVATGQFRSGGVSIEIETGIEAQTVETVYTVGDLRFRASLDFDRRVIDVGAGGKSLQKDQVEAFLQLTLALVKEWTPGEVNAVPRHQDLALGTAAWLAEAPSGYEIRDRQLPFAAPTTAGTEPISTSSNRTAPTPAAE